MRLVFKDGRSLFLTGKGGVDLSDEEFEELRDQVILFSDLLRVEDVEVSDGSGVKVSDGSGLEVRYEERKKKVRSKRV
ncbi:MAG: hypothetical protein QXI56_08615 [Candidatus Bathyarchaeia archaeon]